MDSYVRTFLESWNLEKYIDVFAENEISRINFHLLTKDAITELIPKIGPRALFLREFQKLQIERRIEMSNALENSICNSYDLNFTSEMKDSIEMLDIVPYDYNNRFKIEKELNGTVSESHDNKENFKKTDVYLLTESSIVEPHSSTDSNAESSSLNLTTDSKNKSLVDSSKDSLKQENAAEISDQDSWDFNIKQILSKSNSGKQVLHRLNTENLTTDYRYKLTRILVEELVRRFGPYPSRDIKENLAEAVVKSFPFLKDEDGSYSSWFTGGKNHKQSTGYLEERLRNHRRKYCRERSPETFADEICLPANAKKRRRKMKTSCSDDESIWDDENDDNSNDDDKSENQLQSEKICRSDKNKNSIKLDKKVLNDCDKDSDNEELDELMVVSYHDYCTLKNELEILMTKLEEEKKLRQNLENQIQNSVGVIKKEGNDQTNGDNAIENFHSSKNLILIDSEEETQTSGGNKIICSNSDGRIEINDNSTENSYYLKKCKKFKDYNGHIYIGGNKWIPKEKWKTIIEMPKDYLFVKTISDIVIGQENLANKELLKHIPEDKLELIKDIMIHRLKDIISEEEKSERLSSIEFYLKQHIWDLVRCKKK